MARFVVHEAITLSRNLDADETGYVPAGAVTVKLDGGAPITATHGTGTVYTAPLGRLALGTHSVSWFDGATEIALETLEVVSDYVCSVADIRAGDSEFADVARFPAEKLRAGRAYVNDEFERITGRSFVRRSVTLTEVTAGDGYWLTGLRDSPALKSLTVNGVAVVDTLSAYTLDESGILEGPALDDAGNTVVAVVEYGHTSVPEDVRRVAGIRVRSVVSQADTGVPDRATSIVSPDGGQISLATAGRAGYETGIPEVDAVLARYTFRIERDLWGAL